MMPHPSAALLPILLALATPAGASGGATPTPAPAAVEAFIDEVTSEHALRRAEVATLLRQARFQPEILRKMGGRAERKAWYQYRPIFLNRKRIQQGVAFWRDNATLLRRAEAEYGVDPAIIVAILGVETYYGRRTGSTRVLDALFTLTFGYPKRAPFFRGQLKHLILLAGEAGIDPATVTGSYAGAMGAAQFIPGSYRDYAVDYDADGRTDLWSSPADIIGSVANYFARHHWRPGSAVALRAEGVTPARHAPLFFSEPGRPLKEVVLPEERPPHTLAALRQAGIEPARPIDDGAKAYLLPLETSHGHFEYWLGLHNFYVITRYNRSPLYAMAVHQLSREIAQRRARSLASLSTP